MKNKLLILSLAASPMMFAADLVTNIPMETNGKAQIATSSGANLTVRGKHTDENIAGASGNALRFDGYSTHVVGDINPFSPTKGMTVSMWVAPETYPIVEIDVPTQNKIRLAGTYNPDTQNGWSFNLGYTGKYSFDFYSEGWPVSIEADDLLPCYEWSHLVAVIDTDTRKATLYRNGNKVGEKNTMGNINNDATYITIGRSAGGPQFGNYFLDTFNGLIDDIDIYDGILTEGEISSFLPANYADLYIPESRFANDIMRPHFHGMPGANWTNETHGMTYSNGKYHVFFQKNANGPYMARLHWGHISSDNLYDWVEEPIAIAPGADFDIKGCWSGCIFTDEEITGGKPNALYTGVDYAKAMIVQAKPLDDDLIDWEKGNSPIINGRPSGLSDDFRDPYFFRNGDNAYIIVGTSKDNLGAATLHKYNPNTKSWSNDGSIFYQAKNVSSEGRFWEMPNLTKMENGKWLFTVTPQGQSNGVHTIYWTGDIASDGTFLPDSETPKSLELISKDGYGLLSPTVYAHDGKVIALGIVPDKISIDDNCNLGWAHTYSFPREWSLDNDGNLIQKPFSGLAGLRSETMFKESNFNLDCTKSLAPVEGRRIELLAKFEVGNATFGFEFLKNSRGAAKLTYNPSTGELKLDVTALNRITNDKGRYDGIYSCILPERPAVGSEMTLNVFVDGSIIDIFVNDKWATSIRVFANAADATGVEAFAEGGVVKVNQLNAWILKSNGSPYEPGAGVDEIFGSSNPQSQFVSVYTITGAPVKLNVRPSEALEGLKKGIYIVGNKKVIVK